MKSLFTRAVLIASLASTGNAAMAANITAHHATRVAAHAHPAVHAVPRTQLNADIGQFIRPCSAAGRSHIRGWCRMR